MSEQRIVVETLCEHGLLNAHDYLYGVIGRIDCPGGSRRIVELPDMEKLREAVVQWNAGELLGSDIAALAAAARWVLNLTEEE